MLPYAEHYDEYAIIIVIIEYSLRHCRLVLSPPPPLPFAYPSAGYYAFFTIFK